MAFEQKHILSPIISHHAQLPGVLLALKNWQDLAEFGDPCNFIATSERARDCNLEVLRRQQLRRHVP